ncbi:hypothetical protein [Halomontanus rarus]|uniref:hypothetical protein n=1 Tax=Halomontanus rarus TaxID=3034020 RepID=UPI0023E76BA4|nr:hypothetical protein [Halovivax sp. TS33]
MTQLSRRRFLAAATATVATTIVPGLATADTPDWSPDHIVNVGDEDAGLRRYQPYLDIRRDDQQSLIGIYGWYADSDTYDTRAYYYWAKYAKQDSLADQIPLVGPLFAKDSHFGDHEPVIVFTDAETGAVEEVVYSGYHHFGVQLAADQMTLVEDEADQPTHPSLEVATPHHHYRHQRDGTRGVRASSIAGAEFGSFLEKQSAWEKNGVFGASHEPAVFDPWEARDQGTWWAEDSWDYRFARIRLVLNWRDESHDDLIQE